MDKNILTKEVLKEYPQEVSIFSFSHGKVQSEVRGVPLDDFVKGAYYRADNITESNKGPA